MTQVIARYNPDVNEHFPLTESQQEGVRRWWEEPLAEQGDGEEKYKYATLLTFSNYEEPLAEQGDGEEKYKYATLLTFSNYEAWQPFTKLKKVL